MDGRSGHQQQPGKNPSDDTPKRDEVPHGRLSAYSEEPSLATLADALAPQKLNELVDSFRSDLRAQGQGLDANLEGTGPGLKVVLRDEAGSLIRQYTSQEFLRLRTASAIENGNRGKILDQKL